jgi:hypothetical protein
MIGREWVAVKSTIGFIRTVIGVDVTADVARMCFSNMLFVGASCGYALE